MSAAAAVHSPPIAEAGDDRADQRLLQAIAGGDRRALETLYRAYRGRVLRFLRRMNPREHLGDEVVNEVFWVVWNKAGEFQGQSRVSTWIIGIAYRCMLKALRAPGGGSAELSMELADAHEGPDSVHERQQWLARGLATLPPDQRTTLQLAYCFGHSMEEIAEITGCPVGTVKARLFHARVRLRHVLPALGGFDTERVS